MPQRRASALSLSALSLSGERFTARYRLHGPAAEIAVRARAIGLEQTVEFPEDLLPGTAIRAQIVGELAGIEAVDDEHFDVLIRYPVETAGRELTQLINVLFGNVALQPGVRLLDLDLPASLLQHYPGPRFGIAGLRALLDVHGRPLLCTALKPMGLGPTELAELAYRLALGGIDLIKDDHGLADQSFCPFAERVPRCAEAVARANRETGQRCRYLPNVTAPAAEVLTRARLALASGAGGLLFCPGLAGLDAMRNLTTEAAMGAESGLPILSHPALLGGLCVGPDAGLGHGLLYGLLTRLAGADASIFPSFGGRFALTAAQCREIVAGARAPLGHLAPIWPVPAGGMRLERVPELCTFYGHDCILLIGGDLHAGSDLTARCRAFRQLVARAATAPAA
ncbi:MAG: ribulose 1,5-bisphosphate carboxylase large subunit [Chromatiaceae bacterium]|nr:MAG: ribulose 1,5-bisphosphate carboxylase large subunit [Chromatiaceae bacterium]